MIGEGMRHVNKKEHLCYLVRIPKIDDGSTFHVVKKNFKVEVAPQQAFESKTTQPSIYLLLQPLLDLLSNMHQIEMLDPMLKEQGWMLRILHSRR